MSRVRHVLAQIFTFSPSVAGFFVVTVAMHALLKMLVGLTLVFDDGYGFGSLVAPPQSLVFAGSDVVVCFLVARVLDAVPERAQRMTQTVLLTLLLLFLTTNFIVHSYFKTFVNRGLIEFNGASAHEITDYALSGLNKFAITFVVGASALLATYLVRFETIISSRQSALRILPGALLGLGIAGMIYVGTLSSGQCGFLAYNPGFQLARSYASASTGEAPRASVDEARRFREPLAPIHGVYDSALDADIPSQQGRNVLFVLIESLPFEQTVLGGADEGLPVLSELAQNAVVFDNFRTVFPATSRSFITYHCGIYPTTGAASATKYRPGYRCDSILDGLKQSGYRTGFFTAPMFTYDNLHKADFMRSYDAYEDFLSLKAEAKRGSFTAPAVEEEVVTKKLLEFVKEKPRQPFFATYFMFWNHAPYRLPFEDISNLKPIERYRRTLAYLDEVLRNLLNDLRESGTLDNTVVVVAADHGEGFALHHDNNNHVGHVFEDDVRVPFLIHAPGLGAHRTHRQASNVDFAPTLFKLLRLPRAASWQGQDLLARDFKPRPTLLFGRASYMTNAIVDGNLKYIEYPDTGTRMLFDLATDPHEQRNLLKERSGEANDYRELTQRWLRTVEHRAWEQSDRRISAR